LYPAQKTLTIIEKTVETSSCLLTAAKAPQTQQTQTTKTKRKNSYSTETKENPNDNNTLWGKPTTRQRPNPLKTLNNKNSNNTPNSNMATNKTLTTETPKRRRTDTTFSPYTSKNKKTEKSGDSSLPPSDADPMSHVTQNSTTMNITGNNNHVTNTNNSNNILSTNHSNTTYDQQDTNNNLNLAELNEQKMETQSDCTIESVELTNPPRTYSQVLRSKATYNNELPWEILNTTDDIDFSTWDTTMTEILSNNNKDNFNTDQWNMDKIIEAMSNPENTYSLISHKLTTKPTSNDIPPATQLKFKHLDTAYFTTFTQNKPTMPAYQKEFTTLLSSAID
jgi:hypothetical protein